MHNDENWLSSHLAFSASCFACSGTHTPPCSLCWWITPGTKAQSCLITRILTGGIPVAQRLCHLLIRANSATCPFHFHKLRDYTAMCLCVWSSVLTSPSPPAPHSPLLSHAAWPRTLSVSSPNMTVTWFKSRHSPPVKPSSKCSIGSCRQTSLVPEFKQCHLFPIRGSWVWWIQVRHWFTCLFLCAVPL